MNDLLFYSLNKRKRFSIVNARFTSCFKYARDPGDRKGLSDDLSRVQEAVKITR